MKASLVVIEGKPIGLEIPLKQRRFTVGREPKCNLRPNSDLVSKLHCLVEVDEGVVRVSDLGSTNGTFVNETRVEGPVDVKNGDRVRVGPLLFLVKIALEKPVEEPVAASPAKAAKPASKPAQAGGDDDDDPLQWLMADSNGTLAEPSSDSTVMEMPAVSASSEDTVTDFRAAKDPMADSVSEAPPAAAPAEAPKANNTAEAAQAILNKLLSRRRPG